MAETIATNHSGQQVWKWFDIVSDLEKQGGLSGVMINPLSVIGNSCTGTIGDNSFCLTWAHNAYLLLTMSQFSQELVDAFSKVIEYLPYCRYESVGGITVEWERTDPDLLFATLQQDPDIRGLVCLAK